MLSLSRRRNAQLYAWGERNEVTQRFLGAVQASLSESSRA